MNHEETPPEQQAPGEEAQSPNIEENIRSRSTWLRLVFMIVVIFLYAISRIVVGAVVVLQFFWVLFTGSPNRKLERLGQSLATYTYQIIRYLTFITDKRPFPFDEDWPSE